MRTHLGAMLALYRASRNWGVRDLAPHVGISIATLSRIERGHGMDVATMLKVWQWLIKQARPDDDARAGKVEDA